MYGQYGFSETVRNIWALAMTKVWFPGARLVRRPFYLRGGRKSFKYGPGLTLGYSCRFETGPEGCIRIGKNCKINDRVHISSHDSVSIGDDVLMASNIFISDNSHGEYGVSSLAIPKACLMIVRL
jgi:acetyltransferase-like isoleucine patch superfamily enzyme